jgi:predicted phosphodiesterase
MRYLVLSDVHANLHALDAVLAAAAAASYDRVVVLGDLVGYGANPNEVVDRLRALDPLVVIRGNHDKAACGIDAALEFNATARQAALWTLETLTDEHREYLRGLPAGPRFVGDRIEVCHGSPLDEDEYLFDAGDAARAFEAVLRPLCLFGHTHLPGVFLRGRRQNLALVPDSAGETLLAIEPDTLYLINPGSVGQPRDGDPRAAYALVDEGAGEVIFRRVAYRVDDAQAAIRAAGLPPALANRLSLGR